MPPPSLAPCLLRCGLRQASVVFCAQSCAAQTLRLGLWGLVLGAWACAPVAHAPPIVWETDVPQALARAKAAQLPVLLRFGARWCGACQRLEDEVWPDPKVREAAARFVAVHVDLTDTQPQADAYTKDFAIQSLPTVVFIDSAGQLLETPRLRTFLPPRAMRQMLRSIR